MPPHSSHALSICLSTWMSSLSCFRYLFAKHSRSCCVSLFSSLIELSLSVISCSVRLSFCILIYLSVSLFVYPYLSFHPYLCIHIYLSMRTSIRFYFYLATSISISHFFLSTYLSLSLCLCAVLSVCCYLFLSLCILIYLSIFVNL